MKIIIRSEDCPFFDAVRYVEQVIANGLVSDGSNGAQFCFLTAFEDGTMVYANKTKKETHVFEIRKDLNRENNTAIST